MKVLIIRGGALGDTLMLLPALSVMPEGITVTLVGREPGLGFMTPHVERCMDLESFGWHGLFQNSTGMKSVPVDQADRVIAFFSDRSGDIQRNLEGCFPDARTYTFPSFPPKSAALHVARYVARCLVEAGIPLDETKAIEYSRSHPLISKNTPMVHRNRMVFHPGSGDVKKNHPPEFWCRLINGFITRAGEGGYRKVLLLGPAEEGLESVFDRYLENANVEQVCCPPRERLIKLLRQATLFIGHDSGVSHLSAMFGTPTIALFKTSDPVQWAPLGPRVHVIIEPVSDHGLLDAVMDTANSFLLLYKH